mgnify:CR=1 FL=1
MIKKIIGLLFICLVFFSNTFFKEMNLSDQQKNQKCIYLTFDDGPSPEITEWVLEVLKKFDAK